MLRGFVRLREFLPNLLLPAEGFSRLLNIVDGLYKIKMVVVLLFVIYDRCACQRAPARASWPSKGPCWTKPALRTSWFAKTTWPSIEGPFKTWCHAAIAPVGTFRARPVMPRFKLLCSFSNIYPLDLCRGDTHQRFPISTEISTKSNKKW